MSNEVVPVTVRILEKEYKISCPAGEHESLVASANYVNENMQKIRDGGKALGAERIAVMSAINIAHELFNANGVTNNVDSDVLARIDFLQKSVDSMINTYSS